MPPWGPAVASAAAAASAAPSASLARLPPAAAAAGNAAAAAAAAAPLPHALPHGPGQAVHGAAAKPAAAWRCGGTARAAGVAARSYAHVGDGGWSVPCQQSQRQRPQQQTQQQQQQQQQQWHRRQLSGRTSQARIVTGAAQQQTPHSRHHRVVASAKSSTGVATTATLLQPGVMLEYERDSSRSSLVVLVEPHGKNNWWGVDQAGRRQSVAPKSVSLLLPGRNYSEADVARLEASAGGRVSEEELEMVWEIVADAGEPVSLADLASLLVDAAESDAQGLFLTHRALASDRVFFKQLKATGPTPDGQMYEALPEEQVRANKERVAAEAAEAAEAEAFRAELAAAVAAASGDGHAVARPSRREWAEGRHAGRIGALEAVALSRDGETLAASLLALASDSLRRAPGALGAAVQKPGGGGGVGSGGSVGSAGGGAAVAVPAGLRSSCVSLLVKCGLLRRHEPLQLLRAGLQPFELPEPFVSEAQALLDAPPPDPAGSHRVDLTHLHVYTIDDEGTVEVDDGVSVEQTADGVKIWVHVADPTRWLRPDGQLTAEAARRARTLYLPWGMVPMFPSALATGPFSLVRGKVCDALSIGSLLSPSGDVLSSEVVSSRVLVTTSLSYAAADDILAADVAPLLQGDTDADAGADGGTAGGSVGSVDDADGPNFVRAASDLAVLAQAAERRRAYRAARGSIDVPLPEAKVEVADEDLSRERPRVRVTRISQFESTARGLVAEMMILAGEAVGMLGVRAKLPLPYRGQDAPKLPPSDAMAALPEGPCRAYAVRCCMTRSSVASTPSPHASLGLSAYVQVTSPIRRYADLVAHFQIRAHLQGEPLPFSAAAIDNAMASIADNAKQLGQLEREQEHYWLGEFFRQRDNAPFDALVMGWFREESNLAAVLLEELGWETITRVDPSLGVQPGDRLQLLPVAAPPAEGPAAPPRFSVNAHFPANDADDEGEDGDADGTS